MQTDPKIVTRPDQPYAAIALTVNQPEIGKYAPPLIDKVADWLRTQNSAPVGAPFFNYVQHLGGGRMVMHAGFPTQAVLAPSANVVTGTLPGGTYATLTHTGPYMELHEANMALRDWVYEQGRALAETKGNGGETEVTCLEIYHTDPGVDPSGQPVTEVTFRLAE